MQLLGWQVYLLRNTLGSPQYPPGTNVMFSLKVACISQSDTTLLKHFYPSSPLFKPHERNGIIASNVGLSAMVSLLVIYARSAGVSNLVKFYLIPYLVCLVRLTSRA